MSSTLIDAIDDLMFVVVPLSSIQIDTIDDDSIGNIRRFLKCSYRIRLNVL